MSTGTFLIARVTPESRWIALCTDPYDLKFHILLTDFSWFIPILRKKFNSFLIFPQLFYFLNFYPSPNFPTISNTSSGCLFSAFGSSLKVGLKFQLFFKSSFFLLKICLWGKGHPSKVLVLSLKNPKLYALSKSYKFEWTCQQLERSIELPTHQQLSSSESRRCVPSIDGAMNQFTWQPPITTI